MGVMLKLRGLLVLTLLHLSFTFNVEATPHVPIGYTLPAGLQSVDGSDPFGGCPQTPRNCTAMSPGVCDCPDGFQITGVLIDGVVPMFDPVSGTDWSSGLFTVNRNQENTILIGFQFETPPFFLRGVELKLFNCPAQNIAAPTINVYGSLGISGGAFIPSPSNPIGSVADTLDNQDCSSLITVSIPVQLPTGTSARANYYIQFTFPSGSSIEWVRIGEIQFSDETPTQPPTTENSTTISTTTSPATSEPPITSGGGGTTNPTTASPDSTGTESPNTTESMTSDVSPTTDTATTDGATTSETTSTVGSAAGTRSQIPTIVGVLVAIICLLILLLAVGVIVVLVYLARRNKQSRKREIQQLQDATLEPPNDSVRYSTVKESDTAVNAFYEDLNQTGYAAIPRSKDEEELYSVVREERTGSRDGLDTIGNGLYEDVDSKLTASEESAPPKLDPVEPAQKQTTSTPQLPDYAKVDKPPNPPVPTKTPELYRDLKAEKEEGWKMHTETPFVVVSEYSDVGTDTTEKEYYSEIGSENALSASHSGPVLLSKSLCNEMDVNPDYESSGSAIMFTNMAAAEGSDVIYTDPDERFSQQTIYDTIYSEPIQPSLFDFKALSDQEEEETEEVQPYAPIYTLPRTATPEDAHPLSVTKDNITLVQELGTGFFGKVMLAQTVGLSKKDLRLSMSDDDTEGVGIQVAVKMLKANASKKTKLAFEKEYTFMSRLNHPNVIRTLGICTEDNPFIMMEYMENGDLNQYLQKFSTISNDIAQSESEIQASTLMHMAIQVACAMQYLASKNYIHRDLATRNCLVGQNFVVKLADFGMSRNLYESHYYIIRGHAILPVRWMATECFYGKFSAKTDVWAFGVTVWEIFTLAKEKPYRNMKDQEVVQNAIKKTQEKTLLDKPTDCPQEVFNVLVKCWASDPKDRPTFEELHEALLSLDDSSV